MKRKSKERKDHVGRRERERERERETERGQVEMEDVQHLGRSVWTVVSNPPEGDGDAAEMMDG